MDTKTKPGKACGIDIPCMLFLQIFWELAFWQSYLHFERRNCECSQRKARRLLGCIQVRYSTVYIA